MKKRVYGPNVFHHTEGTGPDFDVAKLHRAQAQGWAALQALAATVKPGDTAASIKQRLGKPRSWHPPQIRLGADTICAFNYPTVANAPLKEHDIFFLDMGLIFDGYESDVGRTFVLGDNADMHQCANDAQMLHEEGRAYYQRTRCSGRALYEWTRRRAAELGWHLAELKADGHRTGDFPHHRFSIDSLVNQDFSVASDRWIYEVHLHHPDKRYGAFYEDIL